MDLDKIYRPIMDADKIVPRTHFEEKYLMHRIKPEHRDIYNNWPPEVQKYFLPVTGMKYDMFVVRPDYHHRKGYDWDIVLMPPSKYIDYSMQGKKEFWNLSEDEFVFSEESINKLRREAIEEGGRMPMPQLDYSHDTFMQEGNHRAKLMERMGVDKIPVMVVWGIDDKTPVTEVKIR